MHNCRDSCSIDSSKSLLVSKDRLSIPQFCASHCIKFLKSYDNFAFLNLNLVETWFICFQVSIFRMKNKDIPNFISKLLIPL